MNWVNRIGAGMLFIALFGGITYTIYQILATMTFIRASLIIGVSVWVIIGAYLTIKE